MRRIGLVAILLGICSVASADFAPVDLSSYFNEHRQITFGPTIPFPMGSQTYGGVPFQLGAATANNFWNSNNSGLPGTIALDVALNHKYSTRVHTILNTLWGTSTSGLISLEFFGQNGSYYREDWSGLDQIRSISSGIYLNTTSSPNTHEVWRYEVSASEKYWHDRQVIELPNAFATDTLTGFRLTDRGQSGFQRLALMGLTVETSPPPPPVPEPATAFVLGSGLLGLGRISRAKRLARS